MNSTRLKLRFYNFRRIHTASRKLLKHHKIDSRLKNGCIDNCVYPCPPSLAGKRERAGKRRQWTQSSSRGANGRAWLNSCELVAGALHWNTGTREQASKRTLVSYPCPTPPHPTTRKSVLPLVLWKRERVCMCARESHRFLQLAWLTYAPNGRDLATREKERETERKFPPILFVSLIYEKRHFYGWTGICTFSD